MLHQPLREVMVCAVMNRTRKILDSTIRRAFDGLDGTIFVLEVVKVKRSHRFSIIIMRIKFPGHGILGVADAVLDLGLERLLRRPVSGHDHFVHPVWRRI